MAVAFYRWLRFNVRVRGGTTIIVRLTLTIMCWMWAYNEREKNRSHGVKFCWPMLRVYIWRWCYWECADLQIPRNLDSVVEHLVVANMRSLFALNHRCVELCIMDVKLHCDLFNMLVCSTTSYACEVWVDSKKIKAIKIVNRRFLKSLLGVWKITSTSIVLVEFGKFPFEHFALG